VHFPSAHRVNSWLWLIWLAYWLLAGLFVHRTKSTEPAWRRMEHSLLIWAGAILLFHDPRLHIIPGRLFSSDHLPWIGNAVTFIGLLFAVWARAYLGRNWSGVITIKQGHRLITGGPYRFVRNPIYTGLLVAAFGTALMAGTADAFIGCLILFLGFLIRVRREESMLHGEFGAEFDRYKAAVPALIPFLYGIAAATGKGEPL
jgi:protein-S-isoprenylcysteine O-methyltransferase Ste14